MLEPIGAHQSVFVNKAGGCKEVAGNSKWPDFEVNE